MRIPRFVNNLMKNGNDHYETLGVEKLDRFLEFQNSFNYYLIKTHDIVAFILYYFV